jgi:acetylornithine deacetylase/succinyl-diaminopimelate desuccinylase-like protein
VAKIHGSDPTAPSLTLLGHTDVVPANESETVTFRTAQASTTSPIDTPLWDALARVSGLFYPGATTVPYLAVGATDARFYRGLGAVAYGFGLHGRAITFEDYGAMFHGIDERVDVESLHLSTEMWIALAADFVA